MSDPVTWYISITLLGWLAFPIAYRLLPALADRGYSLSRALGWLVWGFLFWLLASLGVVQNNPAGLIFAAALLGLLSLWALLGIEPRRLGEWLRSRLGYLLGVELLFLAAFIGWALVRAANPEALGTEKPMELAFINAILRSPSFPPHDPWLSGYAISYYYFGYVLVAALAKLTGTPGAVAFNLGSALVFALSAIGAYGLVYNLLNARRLTAPEAAGAPGSDLDPDGKRPRFGLAALLGPLYLLLVSNIEGFLHLLHTRGLFWRQTAEGMWVSPFWAWLDIPDLKEMPSQPFGWAPQRFWWWWRASRVVQDYDLAGGPREIIDEFPFFSFLLGDLHPHVLALPFGLLALGLALNLALGAGRAAGRRPALSRAALAWLAAAAGVAGGLLLAAGLLQLKPAPGLLGLILLALGWMAYARRQSLAEAERWWLDFLPPLDPAAFGLAALALGGLAFLNTWDFPTYVALAAAGFALSRLVRDGVRPLQALKEFLVLGAGLGTAGVLLYLPFYLGFSSQAGGPLPNLVYPTRGAHLWVMFAPLLAPIFCFLLYRVVKDRAPQLLKNSLLLGLILLLGLLVLAMALGVLISLLPELGELFLGSFAAGSAAEMLRGALQRRINQPGGWLTLLGLLVLGLAALWQRIISAAAGPSAPQTTAPQPAPDAAAPNPAPDLAAGRAEPEPEPAQYTDPAAPPDPDAWPGDAFAVLLGLVGTLLVLAPEFFYLRDLFGWRMNTIFKFYYQAWLIWSILAAYASVRLLRKLPGTWAAGFGLLLAAVLVAGLVYPPLSLLNKTNNFNPSSWTLDGSAYYARNNPAEMAAIQWLQTAPPGVVAEAVASGGGSYTEYARAATFSGQPGVLGWRGHQDQWRGQTAVEAIGTRQADLATLFCSRDWEAARSVLERYQVRYVFLGSLERIAYAAGSPGCPSGLMEAKLAEHLLPVFQLGGVTIYQVQDAVDE